MAFLRSKMKCCFAIIILKIHVQSYLKQIYDFLEISFQCCIVEFCSSVSIDSRSVFLFGNFIGHNGLEINIGLRDVEVRLFLISMLHLLGQLRCHPSLGTATATYELIFLQAQDDGL